MIVEQALGQAKDSIAISDCVEMPNPGLPTR